MWSPGKLLEFLPHTGFCSGHCDMLSKQGPFIAFKYVAVLPPSLMKFFHRIHTEFNSLLNVNESADVRHEVFLICSFWEKKKTVKKSLFCS